MTTSRKYTVAGRTGNAVKISDNFGSGHSKKMQANRSHLPDHQIGQEQRDLITSVCCSIIHVEACEEATVVVGRPGIC